LEWLKEGDSYYCKGQERTSEEGIAICTNLRGYGNEGKRRAEAKIPNFPQVGRGGRRKTKRLIYPPMQPGFERGQRHPSCRRKDKKSFNDRIDGPRRDPLPSPRQAWVTVGRGAKKSKKACFF